MSGVSRKLANSFANGICDGQGGSFTDGDKLVYGQTTLVRRVKEGVGTYEINCTDPYGKCWTTKTTLCRINAVLNAIGCDKKVRVKAGGLLIENYLDDAPPEKWDGTWKVIA